MAGLKAFVQPRAWRVRCPECLGDHSTRTEGYWGFDETPRVVWRCPTCKGEGTVLVQRADREADHG